CRPGEEHAAVIRATEIASQREYTVDDVPLPPRPDLAREFACFDAHMSPRAVEQRCCRLTPTPRPTQRSPIPRVSRRNDIKGGAHNNERQRSEPATILVGEGRCHWQPGFW